MRAVARVAGGESSPALGGLGEELLDVDVDVVAHEPDGVVIGGDEVVRTARLVRIEHGAHGAQQYRESPRRAVGIFGPEQFGDLLAHDGRTAPRNEELDEVARLARPPIPDVDGVAVTADPETAERGDDDRRRHTFAELAASVGERAPCPGLLEQVFGTGDEFVAPATGRRSGEGQIGARLADRVAEVVPQPARLLGKGGRLGRSEVGAEQQGLGERWAVVALTSKIGGLLRPLGRRGGVVGVQGDGAGGDVGVGGPDRVVGLDRSARRFGGRRRIVAIEGVGESDVGRRPGLGRRGHWRRSGWPR